MMRNEPINNNCTVEGYVNNLLDLFKYNDIVAGIKEEGNSGDWSLSHTVRNGNFDRFLLYPIDTLTLISASNFVPEQIFTFLVGCTIFTMTFIKLGITLSIIQILQFIALILFGFVFMYSIAMIKFSIIIRVVVITRIGEFFRTVKRFARDPMDVYGNVLSSFFRYIFPLIILAEFPTLVLLDKPMNNLGIVLIVIILFYFISRYYWLNTLKKYTSTGG